MTSPDRLQQTLRREGYRITPQRRLVLQAVQKLGHSRPDEIAAEVQHDTAVNVSTVYRSLDLLEELGLVTHTHLGHGAPTYHMAAEADHLHVVCESCGGVQHVAESFAVPLADALREEHGFEMDARHFAVYGRCRACASRPQPPSTT